MSQTPYDAISQGPVIVPMDTYAGQTQRIMPPPENWCNARRTKVIIAIVLLTILYIVVVIVYAMSRVAVERNHYPY